jgi:hypothetical protein
MKTLSFLDEIITSRNEIFEDCESDMAVGLRKLGNMTRVTAKSIVILQQIPGSSIVNLDLQAKISDP